MSRNGRWSPGYLDDQFAQTPTVNELLMGLSMTLKRDIADACAYLASMVASDPRFEKSLTLVLREGQRAYTRRVADSSYDHDMTQRLRGLIQGLREAERLLTNPDILAKTRNEMLGIEESAGPLGDQNAG